MQTTQLYEDLSICNVKLFSCRREPLFVVLQYYMHVRLHTVSRFSYHQGLIHTMSLETLESFRVFRQITARKDASVDHS